MDRPPQSRLIPPDADAVRAASRAARPRARGLGVLLVAALAGAGLSSLGKLGEAGWTAPDDGAPAGAAGSASSLHQGRVALAAAAPLRLAASREAELELDVVWAGGAGLSPEGVDAARAALAAWIGARRPAELTTAADDAGLRAQLQRALFPRRDGEVAAIAVRRIQLR